MTLQIRTVIGWRSREEPERPKAKRSNRRAGRPHRSPVTANKIQRIAELRDKGKTFREITAYVDLSLATVFKYAPDPR